ncbi:hypothetical protein [Brunnivagina elsteri]|nr:hypothetical protein [Calothrix elsteri]
MTQYHLKCGAIAMQIFLIANTIFEVGIGLIFLLFPTLVLENNALSISLLRIIGCGALGLGSLSFLMLDLTDKKALKPGLIALSIFHSLAAVSQIYSFLNSSANIFIIIIHSLFAVSFISISWQRIREK